MIGMKIRLTKMMILKSGKIKMVKMVKNIIEINKNLVNICLKWLKRLKILWFIIYTCKNFSY